jgi:hypothetical protein
MRMHNKIIATLLFLCGCSSPPVDAGDDGAPADLAPPAGADLAPPAGCSPACSGLTPKCNAAKHCVGCLADADCAMGTYCKIVSDAVASCTPGCQADNNCAPAQKCCGNRCTDPMTDAKNCGGCDMACSGNHAAATCAAGQCAPGKCDPGWGDCNNDPKDGCEANLHADPNNCTMCGAACAIANAYAGCADGCYSTACKWGFDDCNNNTMDGCETSVLSDVKNCGSCGHSCANLANAMAGCVNGNCVLSSCTVGFADCDKNAANGCEVLTNTDVNNCGKCGNVCPQGTICKGGGCTCAMCNIPNASALCVNNMCVFDKCNPGFGDCNNNKADGCEVNLNVDKTNCGACGNVCPMNLPSCNNGVCSQVAIFGPMHTFVGMTTDHYITQGCCSVNCAGNKDVDALYFCQHFYKNTCTVQQGYFLMQTPNPTYPKMHKNGGCTGNGSDIPNTTCENGPCKIGNWSESTNGLVNLVCVCP